MAFRVSAADQCQNLLDRYDTWMFDCDGVLWRDEQIISGVIDALDMLRKRGELWQSRVDDSRHRHFSRKTSSFCDK